jgi:beta-lactamase class A
MRLKIRLAAAAVLSMAMLSSSAAPTPPLQAQLEALSQRALPGIFGIAVLDLQSGTSWGVHADRVMPMMSDFKAPMAAAILARIDAGSLTAAQTVTLSRQDIVEGSAVPSIGSNFQGERMTFTLAHLMGGSCCRRPSIYWI